MIQINVEQPIIINFFLKFKVKFHANYDYKMFKVQITK